MAASPTDMGDARMLEMAKELIADQRKSLDSLLLEQQQAVARADARRRGDSPTAAAAQVAREHEARATGPRRSSRLSGRHRPYDADAPAV